MQRMLSVAWLLQPLVFASISPGGAPCRRTEQGDNAALTHALRGARHVDCSHQVGFGFGGFFQLFFIMTMVSLIFTVVSNMQNQNKKDDDIY